MSYEQHTIWIFVGCVLCLLFGFLAGIVVSDAFEDKVCIDSWYVECEECDVCGGVDDGNKELCVS